MSRTFVLSRVAPLGKRLCVPVAVVATLVSISSAADAAAWSTKVLGVVDMPFEQCMDRSEHVLRRQDYRLVLHAAAVGGYRGDYSAQIMCAPRGVVVGVVVGPDLNQATAYLSDIAEDFLGSD